MYIGPCWTYKGIKLIISNAMEHLDASHVWFICLELRTWFLSNPDIPLNHITICITQVYPGLSSLPDAFITIKSLQDTFDMWLHTFHDYFMSILL